MPNLASTTLPVDFEAHNREAKEVWDAYRAGKPIRTPFVAGNNVRYTMHGHAANPRGIDFKRYMADPQLMLERQIEHSHWVRHNLVSDAEMGLPQKWGVYVDFQNVYEAAWLGAPVHYHEGQVPDTSPILNDDDKRKLFDRGIPDPFEGPLLNRAWEFHGYMKDREAQGWEYMDRPIVVWGLPGEGTDGPLTIACSLRGGSEFCLDMAMDPEYACELLDFITEATIARMSAFRERLGQPAKNEGFGFADDAVAMLSPAMYEDMVLPRHKRLVDAFSEGGPNGIHLCGNATHLFPLISDKLNVKSFDTGFPVDFGKLRKALGPDVAIQGGPSVPFLEAASLEEITAESKRILLSGVKEGGKFVFREGNNLSPAIGPEKVATMYAAVKEWGRY